MEKTKAPSSRAIPENSVVASGGWPVPPQLFFEGPTQPTLRQSAAQWQQKFQAEQAARQRTEQQAEEYRRKGSQLWQENQALQQQVAQMDQAGRMLYAGLQELQPLRVWAGHPCCKCGQPMAGVVDRETAARLMKDFGHKGCLEKQGSGLDKLLLAGGALYGLSRLC